MVVVYLRRLGGMPDGLDYRQIWALHGLSLSSATIESEMRRLNLWNTEIGREIATIALLAAAAMASARTTRSRWAAFLFTFAVWDLTYYGWLRLLTGFPASLDSTDIYYLVPIAWYGPVWFPVAMAMPLTIALSGWLLFAEPAAPRASRVID
jgi:hypothetical protein